MIGAHARWLWRKNRERATITWSYRANKSLPSEEMSEQRGRGTGHSKARGKQEKELVIWCYWAENVRPWRRTGALVRGPHTVRESSAHRDMMEGL